MEHLTTMPGAPVCHADILSDTERSGASNVPAVAETV
jgi:hypothetical protein